MHFNETKAIFAAMEKKPYSKDYKVGVLGGGQLGRMLMVPAIDLDIKLRILDPDPEAPCSKIAHEFVCGSFNDADTVASFGESCDVVTVEIEHVSTEGLRRLEAKGVKVFPQPEVLETIQDKGLQKLFYQKHNLPTAPFRLVEGREELEKHKDFLPFVQKLRKGGYDGRGVQVIRSEADFVKAFDAPSILEKFVDFSKELAIIVARNEQGDIKTFPVVELEFNPEANLVEFLFAPAQIIPDVTAKAEALAGKVVEAFGLVGILAIELFLTPDMEIMINEVAPRTHNSGHHTIEGNNTSQFAQHLRAITGMPLGDTSQRSTAAMVNLLGSEGYSGPVRYEGLEEALSIPEVYAHLYGKAVTKPFRKMGHVTVCANSYDEVRNKVERIKELIQVKS